MLFPFQSGPLAAESDVRPLPINEKALKTSKRLQLAYTVNVYGMRIENRGRYIKW
jgi:hypothetical protein